jgi:hypothetical protein
LIKQFLKLYSTGSKLSGTLRNEPVSMVDMKRRKFTIVGIEYPTLFSWVAPKLLLRPSGKLLPLGSGLGRVKFDLRRDWRSTFLVHASSPSMLHVPSQPLLSSSSPRSSSGTLHSIKLPRTLFVKLFL